MVRVQISRYLAVTAATVIHPHRETASAASEEDLGENACRNKDSSVHCEQASSFSHMYRQDRKTFPCRTRRTMHKPAPISAGEQERRPLTLFAAKTFKPCWVSHPADRRKCTAEPHCRRTDKYKRYSHIGGGGYEHSCV